MIQLHWKEGVLCSLKRHASKEWSAALPFVHDPTTADSRLCCHFTETESQLSRVKLSVTFGRVRQTLDAIFSSESIVPNDSRRKENDTVTDEAEGGCIAQR